MSFKVQFLTIFYLLSVSYLAAFAQDQTLLKIQKGHTASVIAADFSPDGKKLATIGDYGDGLLIIWDIETGRELLNKKISSEHLSSVKFSPDGNLIITTDDTETLKLINTKTGEVIREHHFKWGAYYAEFSPDNEYYLVLHFDSIHVFDIVTGKSVATFSNEEFRPESAYFSPDSKKIIASYQEKGGSIKIFDLTRKEKTKEINIVDSALNTALFDKKESIFYTCGNYLKTWSLESFKELNKKTIDPYSIISPDQLLYAKPSNWDETTIFDLKTNKKIAELAETQSIIFSPNVVIENKSRKYYFLTIPRNFVVVYKDMIKNYTDLWELTINEKNVSLKKIKRFEGQAENINVIKSGNGNKLLVGGDFYLNLWDLCDLRNTHRFDDHIQPIYKIDIDSSSDNFVASTSYSYVKLWNINSEKAIKDYEWDGFKVVCQLLFSKDGKYLLAGRKDGNSMIWSINSDSSEYSFIQSSTFGASKFSPYGNYIATPTWDTVFIYNTVTHNLVQTLNRKNHEPVVEMKYSPDNKTILTYCEEEDSLVSWDIETGRVLNYYKPNSMLYNFTPDGQSIVIYDKRAVHILDVKTGKLIAEIELTHEVTSFDFTKDQKYLIMSGEGMIKLWNFETGEEVLTLVTIYGKNRESIVYTPDGYYMSTKNGVNGVHFIKDDKVYLFDQFDLKYNRPDIVLERLGYASKELIDAYHKAYLKRLKKMGFKEEDLGDDFHIPKSKIRNFDYMPIIEEKDIEIDLNFQDSKYKLDRYNIWINDVALFGVNGKSLKELQTDSFSIIEKLTLSEGNNKIQVSCLNEKGAESYKETVEIKYEPKKKSKPDLYLVTVSVSKYQEDLMNLKYAVKDGRDLVNYFSNTTNQYNNTYVDTFFNDAAQKNNITSIKEKLMQSKVDDQVILYVSGHGLLDDNLDFYFASYDMDFNDPAKNGISYDMLEGLLDSIPARKKLFLMDACHSGEVDKDVEENGNMPSAGSDIAMTSYNKKGASVVNLPKLGLQNTFELMQELFVNLNRGSGAQVISAAAGNSYALESDEWQNGVFTYSILSGLKDYAADQNNDKQITISELKSYVSDKVVELTNGAQKPTSRQENVEFDFRVW